MSKNSKKNRKKKRAKEQAQKTTKSEKVTAKVEKPAKVENHPAPKKEDKEREKLLVLLLTKIRNAEQWCLERSKTTKESTAYEWFKAKLALLGKWMAQASAWALQKVIDFLEWVHKKWTGNKTRLKKSWKALTEEVKDIEVQEKKEIKIAA